jgi:phenylpyruvate tautomerase PptA (4-oxalocrotonate tautomerase family)
MPLICIRSLPFEEDVDVPGMIKAITEDFARGTEVSIEHITVTWEYIPSRHYAVAGLMPATQPQTGSHPVLVDLHAPSFHKNDSIGAMLECIAFSISKRSGVSYSNIFINYHKVSSGNLFDRGKIVNWK